jgi:methionyl-tRNA formyltransferase
MTGNLRDFIVAAAGLKGLEFIGTLIEKGYKPSRVYSYSLKGEESGSFGALALLASQNGIAFEETRLPSIGSSERLFFVGWQFLYDGDPSKVVVFHDSLLPRHRGFAPTVSALLAGDSEIGVTAFRPDGGIDTGPIIRQAAFSVQHALRIGEALRRQARLMADIAMEILDRDSTGDPLVPWPQANDEATYSLWRDDDDYLIDFQKTADDVVRFIHAVGPPYRGALSYIKEKELRLFDAEVIPDLPFQERHPGKIWRLDGEYPVVVCGAGLVKLTDVREASGAPAMFRTLRAKFRSRPL